MNPVVSTARLGSVSLDALVTEAALMSRVDRKYLVPLHEVQRQIDGLDSDSRVLEISGRREFSYDSVYFDTADHLSYRLTAQRRRRRFKLRTRCYLDTDAAFLEVKTKSGRGATVKERVPYGLADRARITEIGRDHVVRVLGEQGYGPALVDALAPALVSRYQRTTLLLPDGSRATIDCRLQWVNERVDGLGAIELPDHAIIESKSTGGPSQLDRALWRTGYRPSGISKFGTGTAALHPELPGNKWTRVLNGPFASSRRQRPFCAPAHMDHALYAQ